MEGGAQETKVGGVNGGGSTRDKGGWREWGGGGAQETKWRKWGGGGGTRDKGGCREWGAGGKHKRQRWVA